MEFLSDWFSNPQWWFKSDRGVDRLISSKYSHLLEDTSSHRGQGINTNADIVSSIIIFDQLPRHIFREEYAHHIIHFFLQKALCILESVITDYGRLDEFSNDHLCFMLLPLRHTNEHSAILRSINIIWMRLSKNVRSIPKVEISRVEDHQYLDDRNVADDNLLKKFLVAAYKQLGGLEKNRDITKTKTISIDRAELDENSIEAIREEFHTIIDHTQRNENRESAQEKVRDMIILSMEANSSHFEHKFIIVSLSGGVDSMVLAHCLKKDGYIVIAIHINYNNRSCSRREHEFICSWCRHIKIPLFTRHINEINRDPCKKHGLRDLYESYTKNIRFSFYKQVWKHIDISGAQDTPPPLCVCLGHNKDDCMENIMTNIIKKDRYDDLKGMSSYILVDSIKFIRPMLEIEKKDIYQYAIYHNIPHLCDSTPKWSQRGKMRDDLLPALESFHERTVESFFKLSEYVSQCHDMVCRQANDIMSRCVKTKDGNIQSYSFDSRSVSNFPRALWRDIFDGLTNHKISDKSLTNFMRRFEKMRDDDRAKSKNINANVFTVNLHKCVRIIFNENGFRIEIVGDE